MNKTEERACGQQKSTELHTWVCHAPANHPKDRHYYVSTRALHTQ